MYGQLGVLAYDNIDDKVQCHVCGKWFIYLAPHLRWKHNLTVDEYREDFGLNRRHPLCAEGLSEKHRRHFIEAGLVGKHLVFNLGELFSHKGQKERLEARLNMSRTRTGRPIKLTPQGKDARRQNVRKNFFAPLPCVECGTIVVANKFGKGSVVCPECRREHKRKYMKQWADANRQHLREYWRDYDRKRSPRVDKGKAEKRLSLCNPR